MAVLKNLAWADLGFGIACYSDYDYHISNGDVSIGMNIHPEDPAQNFLKFSWKSEQNYGSAKVEFNRTYNKMAPLCLSVDTPLHNVHVVFMPPNLERNEFEYAERHVSVQNEETRDEISGDNAMRKLEEIGIYARLPERLGREEIRSIVSTVVSDITTHRRMHNPFLYFLV